MIRLPASLLFLAVTAFGAANAGAATSHRFHHHDLRSVEVSPHHAVGGSATVVTGTVTLNDPAETGGVTVTLTSSTAAAGVPATVTVPEGQTSATFTVTTAQVDFEHHARIRADLGNQHKEARLSIDPFDVTEFSFNPSTIVGGTAFTGFQQSVGTVTLSAPAGASGVVVTLTASNTGTSMGSSVTVPSGATSVNFSVIANAVTVPTVFTMRATVGHSHRHTYLTVVPAS